MAGTVDRAEAEPDAALSVGMRLWRRGIIYRSDSLANSRRLGTSGRTGRVGVRYLAEERIPAVLFAKHPGP